MMGPWGTVTWVIERLFSVCERMDEGRNCGQCLQEVSTYENVRRASQNTILRSIKLDVQNMSGCVGFQDT